MQQGAPVSILIPAYNEEDGILRVIEDLRRTFLSVRGGTPDEIIVVDDGSTDATGERARAAGVQVIRHNRNLGYGAAMKSGLRAAAHEIIVMIDADASYPAAPILELVSKLDAQCDMAIGARSGKNVTYPMSRRPAKWVLKQIAVFLVNQPIPDLNSGLRAFRKSDAMRFFNLFPSGFSFTTTITLAYLSSDLLVDYVPIDYHPRAGISKIRPFRDTKNLLLTIIRSILFFNPLRVCLPVGFALAVAGLYVLLFVKDAHGNIMDGTVTVLALAALQVILIGFLADVIARMR